MADYLLGKIDEFPEGKGRAFRAGTRTVAVFRSGAKFFAMANRCVHKGASLCEGEITENGTVVRCPWHNWPFRLDNGQSCHDPKEKIRTYEVRLEGDQVILCA
jgi:nitrite reductase (NADH) small subunit